MKRIFIISAAALMAAVTGSCRKEEPKINPSGEADFYASLEGPETKLQVSGQGYVYWDGDESISVNGGTYVIEDLSSPTSASFVYEKGPMPEEGRPFCAFYPSFLQSTDSLGLLPETWTYDPECINAVPMYAYSENRNLKFKNVCALLKISVGYDHEVADIAVSADKYLCGGFVVRAKGDSLVMTGVAGGSIVRLDCEYLAADGYYHGVKGGDFYIPVPPGWYKNLNIALNADPKDRRSEGWYPEGESVQSFADAICLQANTIYTIEWDDIESRMKDHQTDDDMKRDVTELYQYVARTLGQGTPCSPLFAVFNLCGDDVHVPEYDDIPRDIYEFNTLTYDKNNTVVQNAFSGILSSICELSSFLKIWNGRTDTDTQKRCFAEMRVLRAYLQIMLSMGWDGAPVIEYNVLKDGEYAASLTNMEQADVMTWCAGECENAISHLSERKDDKDKEGVLYVTKDFARAVVGMAALYKKDYGKAREYLSEIIKSGKYNLVPGGDFSKSFHAEENGNPEKIFELVCTPSREELALFDLRTSVYVADPAAAFTGAVQGKGCIGINRKYASEMLNNDGNSYRRKAAFLTSEETFYDNGLTYYIDPEYVQADRPVKEMSPKVGIRDSLLCGSEYTVFKCVGSASDIGARNFTLMRYNDVYLMYIEAGLRSGVDVTKEFKDIQERAGSKTVTSRLPSYDELKNERKYELFLDGRRWIDEVRFGEKLERNRTYTVGYDEYWTSGQTKPHNLVYEERELSSKEVDKKYYHFPYPDWFLKMCPNVKQSKGW